MTRPALAIELSQREGSVALGGLHHATLMRTFGTENRDQDLLMAEIDAIVREAGLGPRDLRLIIVAIGPGGFTGLRVSTTAAKCLAETLGVPLVGVESALVVAAASRESGPRLVALASKRDTCWMTLVDGDGDRVTVRDGVLPSIVTADECPLHDARALLADEFVPPEIRAVARSAGLAVETPTFRADACLAVGLARAARGRFDDPVTLAPLYPREPEAVSLWRERTGRAPSPISAKPVGAVPTRAFSGLSPRSARAVQRTRPPA